jgi:hypothetical protein
LAEAVVGTSFGSSLHGEITRRFLPENQQNSFFVYFVLMRHNRAGRIWRRALCGPAPHVYFKPRKLQATDDDVPLCVSPAVHVTGTCRASSEKRKEKMADAAGKLAELLAKKKAARAERPSSAHPSHSRSTLPAASHNSNMYEGPTNFQPCHFEHPANWMALVNTF